MLPDMRLLISATVVTFFLAAAAGLYASLRITQEQIVARSESRAAMDDNPISRISAAWPMIEPGRGAALRELARIAAYAPAAPEEPVRMPERSDAIVARDENPADAELPAVTEKHASTSLNDDPAPEVTNSTGIAAVPEPDSAVHAEHPDIHGNISETIENANADADKASRLTVTKAPKGAKKKAAKAQRRKSPVRASEPIVDSLASGYPLYLTVPVFN